MADNPAGAGAVASETSSCGKMPWLSHCIQPTTSRFAGGGVTDMHGSYRTSSATGTAGYNRTLIAVILQSGRTVGCATRHLVVTLTPQDLGSASQPSSDSSSPGSLLSQDLRSRGNRPTNGDDSSGSGSPSDGATSSEAGGTSTGTEQQAGILPRTFVTVNVGTLAYTRPTSGAAAHGGQGRLALAPNHNMHRLLLVMERQDQQTGRKLVAGWVLSSTCLPRSDIKRALTDFENVGYVCQESHGVLGERRREIAGVMICVDPQQLRFLIVGKLVRHKRVVRRGRILRVRLGVVGAADRSSDFDVLGVYMPPRGSGARGFTEARKNAYVDSVWGSLTSNMMLIARARHRLMIAGDANAELPESLRRADRVARPADGNLDHFRDMGQLGHVHDLRDWTYTGTYRERHIYSVIDHVFLTPALQSEVSWPQVLDGIEVGSKRHRALVFTINVPLAPSEEVTKTEERVPAVRICKQMAGQAKSAYAACKSTYHRLCNEAVEKALQEAADEAGSSLEALDPGLAIKAIQLGTERAMAEALVKHNEKPSGGSGNRPASKPGRPFDAGLLRKQRAVFLIHTLTARRAAIGATWAKAPRSFAAWDRLFIQPGEKLRFGLPVPYWSVRCESAWVSNIAQAYGTAVKLQILGAGGGHCATQADLDQLLSDWGQRVGAVPVDTASSDHSASTSAPLPTDAQSHYEVLSVPLQASTNDIRTAYKRLALLWHPDKRRDVDRLVVTQQFQRISEAHEVLLDDAKRAAHNGEIAQRAAQRGNSVTAHGCYCDHAKTKLSRAGLRLAMKRWHLENNAIKAAMPELRERRDLEQEAD